MTVRLHAGADLEMLDQELCAPERQVLAVFDRVPWTIMILDAQGALSELVFEKYALVIRRPQVEGAGTGRERSRADQEAKVTIRSAQGGRTMVYDASRVVDTLRLPRWD